MSMRLAGAKCACSKGSEGPALPSSAFISILKSCLDERTTKIVPQNEFVRAAIAMQTRYRSLIEAILYGPMILRSALLKHVLKLELPPRAS